MLTLSSRPTKRVTLLALLPFLVVLVIYLPDLGRGFVKDDFNWIAHSRSEQPRDLLWLFARSNGFYRPLVALSFAADDRLFGFRPFGYGLTNLLLLFASMAALASLGRALGLTAGTGVLAAALWALNFHGINMALLWISGRTALCLTLFALLATQAFVQERTIAAVVWYQLALFSKEEAVLLPAILAVWGGVHCRSASSEAPRRFDARGALRRVWPLLMPLGLYLVLRSRTHAFLPWTAPPFYRPTFDLALLARNFVEYADRGCTLSVAVLLVLCLTLRRLPHPGPREQRWVLLGIVWLVGGYGLTWFVPARSSLYACFPSIGAALASAALACSLWDEISASARRRLLVAGLALPLLLVPVYRARNAPEVRAADLSTVALTDLRAAATAIPPGTVIVLRDDLRAKATLDDSFGTLVEEAVRLALNESRLHV